MVVSHNHKHHNHDHKKNNSLLHFSTVTAGAYHGCPSTAAARRRWNDDSKDSVRWLGMSDGLCSCPRSWATRAPEPQVSCKQLWSSFGEVMGPLKDQERIEADRLADLEQLRVEQEQKRMYQCRRSLDGPRSGGRARAT